MPEDDESIKEAAKLAEQALKTAEKGARWLDDVFGEGFRSLGDAFADSMKGFRFRNRLSVIKKTNKAIEDSGLGENIRPLDQRLAMPILEAISNESDETLQDVWAAYIKDALDPKRPKPDRILIEVIRRLEPSDWPILRIAFAHQVATLASSDFNTDDESLAEALDRMQVLDLFDYDDGATEYIVASVSEATRLVINVGEAQYGATRLLGKLANATKDQWMN